MVGAAGHPTCCSMRGEFLKEVLICRMYFDEALEGVYELPAIGCELPSVLD